MLEFVPKAALEYRFRLRGRTLFALSWQREGEIGHLGDHRQDAGIGVVGVGAADAAAQAAIEAFETTGWCAGSCDARSGTVPGGGSRRR